MQSDLSHNIIEWGGDEMIRKDNKLQCWTKKAIEYSETCP